MSNWILCENELPQYSTKYNVICAVASVFGGYNDVDTLNFLKIKGERGRWIMPKGDEIATITKEYKYR